MRRARALRTTAAGVAALATAAAAAAQERDPTEHATSAAAGIDLHYSVDADDTELVRVGTNLDWRHDGPDDYQGIRVERARFNLPGQGWRSDERLYLRAANALGKWRWNAQVGTDGDTVLGSATIHDDSKYRKEFFVEREILETPQGLSRGIYYTFAGAAIDLPVNDRRTFTLVGGVQPFTGNNVRTHLRANYVHVLDPDIGLSAQLRTRYFRNSVPREYDYYSPRWYAQVLPVLQIRRFRGGWMYLVAGGLGEQRDSASGWRRSSYFNARVTSPPRGKLAITGAFLFSETPSATGRSYNYAQFNLGLTTVF